MAEEEKLFIMLEERLELAENLQKLCENIEPHVEGKHKLCKKINAELSFLTSLKRKEVAIKACHVQCTNLSHLNGILRAVEQTDTVTSVLSVFHYNWVSEEGIEESGTCTVDVVGNGGMKWIKIIARSPQAMHRIWQGHGEYGERNLIDHAKNFIGCSKTHPVHFIIPLVVFHFCNGVTEGMATTLTEMGIKVEGELVANPESNTVSGQALQLPEMIQKQQPCITHINLDVSSMVAYVSNVTNGGAMFIFKDGIINCQAEQERHDPVLPKIDNFLQGKELIACESAIERFEKLVQVIGGKEEKERARKLLERVGRVVDDPSDRALALTHSASIKKQSKIIFGTGDKLKAVTITANASFVRAASSQGVNFSVFTHASRALTEGKQTDASPLAH